MGMKNAMVGKRRGCEVIHATVEKSRVAVAFIENGGRGGGSAKKAEERLGSVRTCKPK